MASEISVNVSMKVTKGNFTETKNPGAYTADFNGTKYDAAIQSIPTTATGTLLNSLGDNVGSAGMAFFRNTDSTNYVQVGVQVSGTFYPLLKLKAGESQVFRLATTTVYAVANTAAVPLQYFALED